ncbi:MAG: hypothetical protein CMJ89_15565 [Planctomycetes bacterium]|nr:hypothetical protein [Planctomycetota bacterium]
MGSPIRSAFRIGFLSLVLILTAVAPRRVSATGSRGAALARRVDLVLTANASMHLFHPVSRPQFPGGCSAAAA